MLRLTLLEIAFVGLTTGLMGIAMAYYRISKPCVDGLIWTGFMPSFTVGQLTTSQSTKSLMHSKCLVPTEPQGCRVWIWAAAIKEHQGLFAGYITCHLPLSCFQSFASSLSTSAFYKSSILGICSTFKDPCPRYAFPLLLIHLFKESEQSWPVSTRAVEESKRMGASN